MAGDNGTGSDDPSMIPSGYLNGYGGGATMDAEMQKIIEESLKNNNNGAGVNVEEENLKKAIE